MKGKTKMKKSTNTYGLKSEASLPQAWVAIKKNRQKIYNGPENSLRVYLKDGQEFQIELYNPTQNKILAKIKINGNYTSQRGLILNPGQRYFLDRFIDEDRRLVFSTYQVDNNDEVKKAIEKNGLVEVEFYSEVSLTSGITTGSTGIWSDNPYRIGYTPFWYTTNAGTFNLNSGSGTINNAFLAGNTVNSITYTSGLNSSFVSTSANYSSVVNDQSIETGRVEKGKKSDQSFEDGFGTFNSWTSWITKFQVIPLSQKPVESHEVRSYCTGCGSRIKKQTWKFCPNCGTENN